MLSVSYGMSAARIEPAFNVPNDGLLHTINPWNYMGLGEFNKCGFDLRTGVVKIPKNGFYRIMAKITVSINNNNFTISNTPYLYFVDSIDQIWASAALEVGSIFGVFTLDTTLILPKKHLFRITIFNPSTSPATLLSITGLNTDNTLSIMKVKS